MLGIYDPTFHYDVDHENKSRLKKLEANRSPGWSP
jgi:ABC-type uncharacterized transport system substrate-binding protein